jgi:hypothetical protein
MHEKNKQKIKASWTRVRVFGARKEFMISDISSKFPLPTYFASLALKIVHITNFVFKNPIQLEI